MPGKAVELLELRRGPGTPFPSMARLDSNIVHEVTCMDCVRSYKSPKDLWANIDKWLLLGTHEPFSLSYLTASYRAHTHLLSPETKLHKVVITIFKRRVIDDLAYEQAHPTEFIPSKRPSRR